MLRVSSNNVLVVPPFECAWLSFSDYNLDGGACLSFEVKAENDVTVIFKPIAGAKRWQHYTRQDGGAGDGAIPTTEENYTLILGSHRNSSLKVEKNGETLQLVQGVAGTRVDAQQFKCYWIDYRSGTITLGVGPPGSNVVYQWRDPGPPASIPAIQHIGLSCWDKHVSYRNVQLLPPVDLEALQAALWLQAARGFGGGGADSSSGGEAAAAGYWPPSLFDTAAAALTAALSPASVCDVLQVAELLLPATADLYAECLDRLAAQLQQVLGSCSQELCQLSASALADVLQEPSLAVRERQVFEAVALWATYGQVASQPSSSLPNGEQPCSPQKQGSGPHGRGPHGSGPHVSSRLACSLPSDEQPCSPQQLGNSRPCTPWQQPASQSSASAVSSPSSSSQPSSSPHSSSSPNSSLPCSPPPIIQASSPLQRASSQPSGSQSSSPGQQAASQPGSRRQQQASPWGERPLDEVEALLGLVRFVLMTERELAEVRAHPFSAAHPLVGELMAASQQQQAAAAAGGAGAGGSRSLSLEGKRSVKPRVGEASQAQAYQRRLVPRCTDLMYICDGDQNGVIHHIATQYGTKEWINPVLAKRIEVKASSPASRYTDAKALVSGHFLRTSYTGPRYEGGNPATWWQVDLGEQHRLLCNYYTLRQDGSSDFPRHWVLQGSIDLSHWVVLRRHIGDNTLRLPGQYASWPVVGPQAAMPFRAFRVALAGPTTSVTSPWNLCLSHIELYGYFYKAAISSQQLQQQPQQ